MSHEIRTPLNAVIGFTDLLLQSGLEPVLDLPPELPERVRVDPVRLKQILVNLLTNAIKFTRQGEIELSVGVAPGRDLLATLTFSVRDTGIGIEHSQRERLFQADDGITPPDASAGFRLMLTFSSFAERSNTMRLRFALLSLCLPWNIHAQTLPSDRPSLDSLPPTTLSAASPQTPGAIAAPKHPLGQRLAFGGHYDASFSDDARLVGVHLAQLADRNANQVGWGFSVHFGVTPGFFDRDSADHSGETAPSDVAPTGEKRIQSLALAGGLNICLRSPLWLEATGGYYLPERAARYQTKNGHLKWYAAGDNSALPIGMIALVADFSRYRIPLYARLGAARSDGTTFYSLGLGFAPSLPR